MLVMILRIVGLGIIAAGALVLIWGSIDAIVDDGYKGRHHIDPERETVPQTWHPVMWTVQFPNLWLARMEDEQPTVENLIVQSQRINAVAPLAWLITLDNALSERLNNWNWLNVPTNEWPITWRTKVSV